MTVKDPVDRIADRAMVWSDIADRAMVWSDIADRAMVWSDRADEVECGTDVSRAYAEGRLEGLIEAWEILTGQEWDWTGSNV